MRLYRQTLRLKAVAQFAAKIRRSRSAAELSRVIDEAADQFGGPGRFAKALAERLLTAPPGGATASRLYRAVAKLAAFW